MTIQIRSSSGNQDSNDTTPEVDSPGTITVGDLLAILWYVNDDTSFTIVPPIGWTEVGNVAAASTGNGVQFFLFTKTAVQDDVDNQGTLNQYVFSGLNGTADILYGCFSLHDDAAGTVEYIASSLAVNEQTGGGTTVTAPTQTIAADGSMALCGWVAVGGSGQWQIDFGENYAPTGGANPMLLHKDTGWVVQAMSGSEWVVAEAEFDIADSPIGTQSITLGSSGLASDTDSASVSMIFRIAAAAGGGEVYAEQTISLTNSTTNTAFVFAKQATNTWIRLSMQGYGNADGLAFFDIVNGTVGATKGADNISEAIEDVGNGWFKCSVTFTKGTGQASGELRIHIADANNDVIVAQTTASSVFLWGAGVEIGDGPLSYIKTVASSVTRNADDVTTTTVDWLETAATAVGTWYIKARFPFADAVANALVTLDDGGTTDRFAFQRDAAENINVNTTHNADTNGLVEGTAVIAPNTDFQVGMSYADDNVGMAVDNSLETADTTAALPLGDNPTTLRIGSDSAGNYWNGTIAKVRYLNKEKTPTEITSLSNNGTL